MTAPVFATIHTATTREQRIGVVAYRWKRMGDDSKYLDAGFSVDEIREGNVLGLALDEENYGIRCYYGDPAYGSYTAPRPIQDKVLAMMRVESNVRRVPKLAEAQGGLYIRTGSR